MWGVIFVEHGSTLHATITSEKNESENIETPSQDMKTSRDLENCTAQPWLHPEMILKQTKKQKSFTRTQRNGGDKALWVIQDFWESNFWRQSYLKTSWQKGVGEKNED